MRIGVDLGGTKIEAIALADDGAVRARRRVATPRDDYAATQTFHDPIHAHGSSVDCRCTWQNSGPCLTFGEPYLRRVTTLAGVASVWSHGHVSKVDAASQGSNLRRRGQSLGDCRHE